VTVWSARPSSSGRADLLRTLPVTLKSRQRLCFDSFADAETPMEVRQRPWHPPCDSTQPEHHREHEENPLQRISDAITKLGAGNRAEAVRIASEQGWP
jgi:hypothetical protein